jgi:hypothetical protein
MKLSLKLIIQIIGNLESSYLYKVHIEVLFQRSEKVNIIAQNSFIKNQIHDDKARALMCANRQ